MAQPTPTAQSTPTVIKPVDVILQVRIISPKKMIFLGLADSVTATNSAGKFDILAQHANFITLIKNSEIVIMTKEKKRVSFTFNLAILYAVNNKVTIYTDISSTLNTPGLVS